MTPLTQDQHNELAQRLSKRRQALRIEVQTQLAQSDDPRVVALKNELAATEDWVLADILGDLDIAMVTRDIGELDEVEAALGRIDDGSYGICITCGGPIGWPRLNVNPTAERCITCQEAWEAGHRRPGVASA